MRKNIDSLSVLLSESEFAHDMFLSLPYNVKRDLISNKDKIKSLSDFKEWAEFAKKEPGNANFGDEI